ncbi:hypothetical protein AgCh_012271 [Apium graveolens]
MGNWNAHTSVRNISGSLLAACVLEYGWGETDTPVLTDVEALRNVQPKETKEDSRILQSTSGNRRNIKLLEVCMIPGVKTKIQFDPI